MSKGCSIALVVCGSCVASLLPVGNLVLNLRAMDLLQESGKLNFSGEGLPDNYAWAMFVLGAVMVFLGALGARARPAAAQSEE